MAEQDNVQKVQQTFAAFGRGDIPAVLANLTDDVEWVAHGPQDVLPWAGTYRGPAGAGKFFQALAENLEFQQFEPREFIAQGDRVVTLGHSRTRNKTLGVNTATDWVMVFRLRGGKVSHYDYFDDGLGIVPAVRGA